jgi:mono/diheme cytochrome c family protein
MKRFRDVAILVAVTGCLVFYFNHAPIHAASLAAVPRAQAVQPQGSATVDSAGDSPGAKSYAANCAICHGDQREGNLPTFPPLIGIEHHLNDQQISDIVHKGQGLMPGNTDLKGDELAALLRYLASPAESASKPAVETASTAHSSDSSEAGGVLFKQNCAFCHGRDTMGGESGPDLTQSKIVLADVNGDKISAVVREGRPAKKMPAFNFSAPELESLAAFIHAQVDLAKANKGGRRGVDVSDLQTGNVDEGKKYFDGAGTCAKCHSASGDLAGIAKRYEGLKLEERMLYPWGVKSKVTVTLPSGKQSAGTLEYLDEFTVGMRDSDGNYHSWLVSSVKYKVESPVDAHVGLFSKYTDADIHNLMAYLQTLR